MKKLTGESEDFEKHGIVEVNDIIFEGLKAKQLPIEYVSERRHKFSLFMISTRSQLSLTPAESKRIEHFSDSTNIHPSELFNRKATAEYVAGAIVRLFTYLGQLDRVHTELRTSLAQQLAGVLPVEAYIEQSRSISDIIESEKHDTFAIATVVVDQYNPTNSSDSTFISEVNERLLSLDWSDTEGAPVVNQTVIDPLDYAGTDSPRYYVEIVNPPSEESATT